MKKISIYISIIALSTTMASCRLFQGGGGGGGSHCPAYGSKIEKDNLQEDFNNETELREHMSESM